MVIDFLCDVPKHRHGNRAGPWAFWVPKQTSGSLCRLCRFRFCKLRTSQRSKPRRPRQLRIVVFQALNWKSNKGESSVMPGYLSKPELITDNWWFLQSLEQAFDIDHWTLFLSRFKIAMMSRDTSIRNRQSKTSFGHLCGRKVSFRLHLITSGQDAIGDVSAYQRSWPTW